MDDYKLYYAQVCVFQTMYPYYGVVVEREKGGGREMKGKRDREREREREREFNLLLLSKQNVQSLHRACSYSEAMKVSCQIENQTYQAKASTYI